MLVVRAQSFIWQDRGRRRTKEPAMTRLHDRGKITTPATLCSPEMKERIEERPCFFVDERGADVAGKSQSRRLYSISIANLPTTAAHTREERKEKRDRRRGEAGVYRSS
ncbi:hypothetical protein JCGZ_15548 [Jatropha curcas]|uniref:Uncharacterized protein n=1 Tax=Jatropha curcas TaxID=180498 RepID=A0A067KER8_JATCU|nr:hypothetical protein JCGZ_15548 [Jatropha curcas]